MLERLIKGGELRIEESAIENEIDIMSGAKVETPWKEDTKELVYFFPIYFPISIEFKYILIHFYQKSISWTLSTEYLLCCRCNVSRVDYFIILHQILASNLHSIITNHFVCIHYTIIQEILNVSYIPSRNKLILKRKFNVTQCITFKFLLI